MMRKLLDVIDRAVKAASAVVMFVSVVVIFLQVISRYGFNYTPPWSEELARTGNVWMTFLGIGLVSRVREHIRIDFVDYLLAEKGRYACLMLEATASIAFFALLGWEGYKTLGPVVRQTMPGLQISLYWAYVIIPIGSALLLVFTLEHLIKMTRKLFDQEA
jgi:TRAP-type C4-dicarboxylate transport system permease small subunit